MDEIRATWRVEEEGNHCMILFLSTLFLISFSWSGLAHLNFFFFSFFFFFVLLSSSEWAFLGYFGGGFFSYDSKQASKYGVLAYAFGKSIGGFCLVYRKG